MNRDLFIREMLDRLDRNRERYPETGTEDIVKFIFQGMLGAGHLLDDAEAAERYVIREMQNMRPDPDEPLTEAISPSWCRLNLRRAMAERLSPRMIVRMMIHSEPEIRFTRKDAASVCRSFAAETEIYGIPDAAAEMEKPGWIPSHSDAFRRRYRPAYRVIGTEWIPLLPVLSGAVEKQTLQPRVLITIDGPCASGKTTLAGKLAAVLDAPVIHTDDFVVPRARKTRERLGIPGGNCDWERLVSETIAPWKNGEPAAVRRYDCHRDCMLPPEELRPGWTALLEGSYCNLPAIRKYADIRLFADAPENIRMERLRKRETPDSLKMFYERWIPLESAYFEAYGLPDRNCLTC